MKIELTYDEQYREATLVFANGRTLKLGNVSREQAEMFRDKYGEEFGRRDCLLTTEGMLLKRAEA